MPAHDWKNAPADRAPPMPLATSGLEYRVIDTSDAAVFDPYLQAEMRGFLAGEQSDEQLGAMRDGLAFRRFVGVYDPGSLERSQPVATVNSWVTDLTLPGGRGIPMWAISGVTVAPTHRRKGIARAMLEGELRTAADAGVPIAGLTVSEATIYGRFGFSPATFAHGLVDRDEARDLGRPATRRSARLRRPGARCAISSPSCTGGCGRPGPVRSRRGRGSGGACRGRRRAGGREKLRGVRYADAGGTTRGVAVYKLGEEGHDFTKHELELHYLVSETTDAYAALWRFVLEHDLVSVVKAPLRSVDEPLRWMIADQRGAKVETSEHGWLRILDVPAVLGARTYAASGSFTLRVTDPLGFAEGTWQLNLDDTGGAEVEASDATPTSASR